MESLAFDPGTSSNKTTRLVADLVSFQNFRKWIDTSPKHHWYEDIRSSLLTYLDSCHIFSQEDKLEGLQKIIRELEIEHQAQWISQDSSHKYASFEEFYDQQKEQYESKTDETLLVDSEQYKRGYEAAMAHCYKHYDLRPKVSSPKFILPAENEFSISKQLSYQNKNVVQNSEIMENQSDSLIESYEEFPSDIPIGYDVAIPFESFQGFSKFSLENQNSDKQVVSFSFENDHEIYNEKLKT
jgi:hypothetical protein